MNPSLATTRAPSAGADSAGQGRSGGQPLPATNETTRTSNSRPDVPPVGATEPRAHTWCDLPPGDYWACEQPERPPSDHVHYDADCRSCLTALGAAAAQDPAKKITADGCPGAISREAAYEQYRAQHDLPPLPVRVESGLA